MPQLASQLAPVIDLAAVRQERRRRQAAPRPTFTPVWIPVWVTLVPVWPHP